MNVEWTAFHFIFLELDFNQDSYDADGTQFIFKCFFFVSEKITPKNQENCRQ